MERPERDEALAYLCVDDFMRDVVGARALSSALELGLIDHLLQHQPCTPAELAQRSKLDARAQRLLLDLLRANRIIERAEGQLRLSGPFTQALQYRDLLEAKLDFCSVVAPDFLELFTALLTDPERFFGEARVFELFSYQRCFDSSPESRAHTARWMRITTALTKYEAAACMARHDFSRYARMLDVGGNSGEFALRVCRRHAGLRATVYDLPLVCTIGAEHLAAEPEAGRIAFVNAQASGGALPPGQDLVTFKSMLHDWPEAEMRKFLARAYQALEPGGTLLIFERSLLQLGAEQLPYASIPLLLFFRAYRSHEDYARALEQAGFRDVRAETVDLDLPFMLISARR